MSGLVSNLFRRVAAGQVVAPGFARLHFAEKGYPVLKGSSTEELSLVPRATITNLAMDFTAINDIQRLNLDISSLICSNDALFDPYLRAVQPNEAGVYEVNASIYFEHATEDLTCLVMIIFNSIIIARQVVVSKSSGAASYASVTLSAIAKTTMLSGAPIGIRVDGLSYPYNIHIPAGMSSITIKKIG